MKMRMAPFHMVTVPVYVWPVTAVTVSVLVGEDVEAIGLPLVVAPTLPAAATLHRWMG